MSDNESNNSYDDDEPEAQHLRAVNIDASKDEILHALEDCQLALGRLLAENRDLRKRTSELEATSTSKRRRREKGDNKLGYEAHVGSWARRFFLTREIWVQTSDFRKDRPELPSDPEYRFGSNSAYSRSISTSLFDAIPSKYHSLLDYAEYKHFAKDFITELGSARSSSINSLRSTMGSILASAGHTVDTKLLLAAAADRSTDKVLLGLLRYPGDKTSKVFAPILFPKGEKKMQYIFTSQIVLDVHRVMIHGQSSLVAGSKPDPKANGSKYDIFEATDHSIASAGLMARFLVSADKIFGPVGAVTKTNWEADYRTYRKLLAANTDTPIVKYIFKTFNQHVFAGIRKRANAEDDDLEDDVEDEISAAMHSLAFGELESDAAQSDGDGPPAATNFDDDSSELSSVPDIPSSSTSAQTDPPRVHFATGPPEIRVFTVLPEQSEAEQNSPVRRTRAGSGRVKDMGNGKEKGKGRAKSSV